MNQNQAKTLQLLCAALALVLVSIVQAQQDFTTAEVPNPFQVGDFYPPRPEVEVCRPIRDYIDRNSARFTNELVTNTNPDITFSTSDSRIMSSRMQSRLNSLASLYGQQTGRRMNVLRAWTQFPNAQISDDKSLHYEGRTVTISLSRSDDYSLLLELAVEAAFDWVYYAANDFIQLSVIPTSCDRNVDCVFILDQSGSVGSTNHDIAIQFIQNVVSFFSIGLSQTRVGFVAYSGSAHIEFLLDRYSTLPQLLTAIGNIVYRGGSTATPLALNATRILLDPSQPYGARPNSEGVPKIGILLTDGKTNRYESHLPYAAPALKAAGVQVYSVGIGSIDIAELQLISSDPDDEHVFILSSFRDAAGFVDFLSVTTCETPAIIDPGENTTTNVPEDGIDYFQTECSAFSSTVLVELTDINGTSFLYCSATEANPGPLTENTIRNETQGLTRRTCIVPLPAGSTVVYIGVQGQEEQNAFTIVVWDQLFDPSEVFLDVLETRTGAIYDVSQNLIDSASINDFEFSIIEGNSDGIFSISSSTGMISVSSLNFDLRQIYNLTILAQNSNIDCQRARVRVNIRVLSNRITFEGAIDPVSIPEDSATDSTVATITASGGTGGIQYSIDSGNGEMKFRIDSSTGVISLVESLDYETTMSYTLGIVAVSTGTTSVTGMATQIVNVDDVNESPYFSTPCATTNEGCSFMIKENMVAGTLVDSVVAMDPDLPSVPNGMLLYRFDESASIPPFSVNASGHITTTNSLDREERETYTLTLIVSDGCIGCSISIRTTVTVMIMDENDNAPIFTQGPTTAQVAENSANGFIVAQYIATDGDSGANAEIAYSLSPSGAAVPFSIDSSTGVLTVSGSIDFEMTQSYTVTVTASNPGSALSDSVTTVIEVLNLNDNSPIFSQNPYQMSIAEHSRVENVTVEAMDADLGQEGDVTYSITNGNFENAFTIDSQSGVITIVSDIDREIVSSFSLVVQASDGGTPRRRTTANVEITVTDINDNAPNFLQDPYSTQIREDISIPFNILQAVASDIDEQGNPNSELVYSITGGNDEGMFAINASTGQIQAVRSLDFETTPSYTLNLTVMDRGNPPLSDVTNATIALININEDPPMLSGSQVVEISELASISSIVAVFNALDPDNNTVTFAIDSGNDENKFAIGENNGMITLIDSLDYENTTNYLLQISASDGEQNTTAMLNVTVLDENEFSPVFQGETAFSVDEELPDETLVGTVLATDDDGDPANTEVTYSFVQSSNYFTIDRISGEIRTNGVLDREMLARVFIPPASQISLDVTARDSATPSRQTTTSITITLMDINDNSPSFADDAYENSLLENLPAGQIVFQVSATDSDLGSNAQISYSFALNENTEDTSLFMIDSGAGLISTTGPLDCERQTSYSFTITAADGGTPSRNSTVQGTLTILDENDNDPIFTMNIYEQSFLENYPTMQQLVQVSATDLDKGANGEVRYSIMNQMFFENVVENVGADITFFSINETSGFLTHLTPFNYEQNQQINVTVTAFDLGLPRRSSVATVTFNIQNIDEEPPQFLNLCDVFIVEEMPIGSLVTQCEAQDRDSTAAPGQNPLNYTIVDGNERGMFEIEFNTAIIRNSLLIDSDAENMYTIYIEARDLVNRFTRRSVNIFVRDINDNRPVFDRSSYSYHFTDIDISNYKQEIAIIRAMDVDNGPNGTVRYSIEQGAVNRVSDRETIITITATDLGTPPQSAETTLNVTFDTDCLLQEYEIDFSSGAVQAYVLCSITMEPESVNVNLKSSSSLFFCVILHNSRLTYQWIHNGSLITSPTLIGQGQRQISYSQMNAQFEHAGEYACKATSRAGSLQTVSRSVSIQVPPTITVPPEDIAVEIGQSASFHCAAVGIPTPTVEWFLGTTKISEGSTLMVEDVSLARGGSTYVCLVSSEAGRVSALAKLIVFERTNIVELDVNRINNPVQTDDGTTCHFIDRDNIETILNDLTNTRVMVTSISGENICEESACLPNPCQNGGSCQLSDDAAGGFECSCQGGYTGVDCSEDVNECLDTPCSNEATCVNNVGGFECSCAPGTSGHLCQFTSQCQNSSTCPEGTLCVSTFSVEGFTCRDPPSPSNSIVISFTGTIDIGFLNDVIQGYIETLLATASKNRRRRQTSTTLATSCEPRFIQLDTTSSQTYTLIWLCPENVTEPSPEDQAVLCSVLFESGLIDTCKIPNGDEMTPPTSPPLTDTSVKIEVVLFDRRDEPLSAADSSKTLEEAGAQEQLQQETGLPIEINAPPPDQGGTNTAAGTSVEVAIGVVVSVVLLVLLVVGTVLTVMIVRRKMSEHKDRQQAKRLHAIAMVEKGTTVQENLAAISALPGTVRSHPLLAPMTSTSSLKNLIDDDGPRDQAAGSAQ